MNRDRLFVFADAVARMILAGVFITAAISKIQDPAVFAHSVGNYSMLPDFAVGLVALVLPMVELLAAISLLASKWTRESALLILGLLGVFFIGITQALVRGLDISCGCFGDDAATGRTALLIALARDLCLVPFALLLTCRPNGWLGGTPPRALLLGTLALVATAALPMIGKDTPRKTSADSATPSPVASAQPTPVIPTPSAADITDIRPEHWTTNFPAVLARARAEHTPAILFAGTYGCVYCKRMRKILTEPMFMNWVKGTGLYLAHPPPNAPKTMKDLPDIIRYVDTFPIDDRGIPHIGVYWPRSSNDEYKVAFTGLNGQMPGSGGPSLSIQAINAISFLLKDYFAEHTSTNPLDTVLASTAKFVKTAVKGKGKVVVEPADGVLRDGGLVTLRAIPGKGMRFVRWISPRGETIKPHLQLDPKRIKITYQMGGGTYTAVFRAK